MRNLISTKYRKFLQALLLLALVISGNSLQIFAHGGEDPGDSQPKTSEGASGTVSYTQRLGEMEVMIKHPLLEPDTATNGRLFLTDFATNEPATNAEPIVEIESANGVVTQAAVEKTDSAGSYAVNIPALPEGAYALRAKITYKGETDTATFSGVKVEHPAADTASASSMSWFQLFLIFLVGAVLLALFSSLVFFVWRIADEKQVHQVRDETVAA